MEEVECEFDIIWLDGLMTNNLNEPDYLNRKTDLGNLIDHLHVFNNTDECLDYFATLDVADKVLFILSRSISKSTLSQFHEQTQIVCVYVYCNDVSEHRERANGYPKVRGVFNRPEELVQKIQQDVQFLRHHFIPANIFPVQDVHQTSFQNVNKEKTTFLWFQLLIDVLVRLPRSEQSKRDLIDECRKCYSNNACEQKKISDFELNYMSNQAIEWYTRDCFLFRLINRAFRTRNLDNIFRFRYFFIDLQKQLFELHQTQLSFNLSQTLCRGQIISTGELQQLKDNIGGVYSVNTFFSSSAKSDVALTFQTGAFGKPYFECVLFEILVDNKTDSKWKVSFADIHDVSFNKDEGEVLFGMGSVFHIVDVTQLTPDIWLVNLTLLENSGVDESLREYYLENHIGQQSSLIMMSELLNMMGQTAQAKRYCELLLREHPSEEEKMQIYTYLSYYEYKLDDLTAAKRSSKIALELQNSLKLILPAIYSHMGFISSALGEYQDAITYHQISLEMERKKKIKEDEEMAVVYLNLGLAYYDLSMLKPALYWCEKMALQCQQKLLPSDHPSLSVTYSNISSVYSAMGDHKLARSNLEKALEIQNKSLPPLHFNTHIVLNNLALESQLVGEYKSALNYYRQAQEVIINASPFNPKLFAENYLGIAAVHDCRGNNRKALFYNKMALKHLSRKKPEHHLVLATIYNNIGMLFINMKYYKCAMKSLIKALVLEKHFLDSRHVLWLTTLSNMGMVYEECGLLKKALYLHRKVLNIRKYTLERDHPDLATTWDNIGVVSYKIGKFKTAIKLYQKALRINAIALPFDHPATACICGNLGNVYCRLGNQKLARKYYNYPESMTRACLRDTPYMKTSENEIETLTYDQSTAELDSFTRNYLASINDPDSLVDNNMTINSTV
ncbi:unnamed protein product [Rotaria sp. Silwood2]|nr:unnamed protein product [Rotaria sp. Silwood2]